MVYGGTAIRFCPAHARYPLTVLCFSLQKSLAPSLSSAPLPVQEARPSGPLEFVRGQVPVHSRTAAAPQSYMRPTWALFAFNNLFFKIPYPPILLAPLYGLQVRGAKDSGTLPSLALPSSPSLAPFLTMAEVPLFQYGWTTSRVPQLGPHGSVVDKLSVFSTSRYAGLLCPRFVSV